MKYLVYVFRNIRRNPVRTLLTVASISICLFLMMLLLSYLTINTEVAHSLSDYNRLITMSSQGFTQPVPIANVATVAAMEGIATVGELTPEDKEHRDKKAVSPFSWYGGRYKDDSMPGSQFGIDPETIFAIMVEMKLPPDQLKAFRDDKTGCVIGKKLAKDKNLKIGDPYPLKGTVYEFNLDLTIRGIYDAPENRDNRMCLYHWAYLDEGLKRDFQGRAAGNAGTIYFKCKDAAAMPGLIKKIDDSFRNSSTPTKTQTEEAFAQMFSEMIGDLQTLIVAVGMAVVVSLICVCGVAMAMSMRERTTEVAVLKAIGFGRGLVLALVLVEAVIVSTLGGVVGALGTKLLFDQFDLGSLVPGFLPFFYVPWTTALFGLGLAVLIGFVSGVLPAWLAAQTSVIQGLRKVV
ncbi:MAG: ABC-type transport system, involved in lipoprotein release, permease component [Planctomycetota bacterium]|nr:ABC-type transport system, involved in lipoprotein release, permease component [Planctomycetota bacterium]